MEDKSKNFQSKKDFDDKDIPAVSETTPPEGIHLPEPDLENITVLTHSLPNKPILPWNRYNSLWDETEAEVEDSENLQETNNSQDSSEEE
jgi:hypothetical protein